MPTWEHPLTRVTKATNIMKCFDQVCSGAKILSTCQLHKKWDWYDFSTYRKRILLAIMSSFSDLTTHKSNNQLKEIDIFPVFHCSGKIVFWSERFVQVYFDLTFHYGPWILAQPFSGRIGTTGRKSTSTLAPLRMAPKTLFSSQNQVRRRYLNHRATQLRKVFVSVNWTFEFTHKNVKFMNIKWNLLAKKV